MKNDFNVYELEYTQEFKDKLPIHFDKMKNKDLSDVPELYKVLFITDWNWGSYSSMGYEDRLLCNDLSWEYNNYCILKEILSELGFNVKDMSYRELKKLYYQNKS